MFNQKAWLYFFIAMLIYSCQYVAEYAVAPCHDWCKNLQISGPQTKHLFSTWDSLRRIIIRGAWRPVWPAEIYIVHVQKNNYVVKVFAFIFILLSYFFVKKIPLSRRVGYVMDGSMGYWVSEWVSEWVRDVCMSHQSDWIYYKQPIKFPFLSFKG